MHSKKERESLLNQKVLSKRYHELYSSQSNKRIQNAMHEGFDLRNSYSLRPTNTEQPRLYSFKGVSNNQSNPY